MLKNYESNGSRTFGNRDYLINKNVSVFSSNPLTLHFFFLFFSFQVYSCEKTRTLCKRGLSRNSNKLCKKHIYLFFIIIVPFLGDGSVISSRSFVRREYNVIQRVTEF